MIDHVEEFDSILGKLDTSGALRHVVLIGSWVVHIYQAKYPEIQSELLTTHDVDFSIHRAFSPDKTSSPPISVSLHELGYTSRPKGGPPEGQIFIPDISHPEHQLDVEFLCAHGRKVKEPYLVKGLGVIATPLKYQEILLDNTEAISYKGFNVLVPLPHIYAAHKIAISQDRNKTDKAEKDLICALNVMAATGDNAILTFGEDGTSSFYKKFKRGWKQLMKIRESPLMRDGL